MDDKPKAQIVGKISGKVIPVAVSHFKSAADFLRTIGYEPWNPLDHVEQALDYEKQMQVCLDNIPKMDVIVILDDWATSSGARREVARSLELNKPIECFSLLVKQRLCL